MVKSYLLAVSASCSVALGLNAIVPRLKRVSPSTKIVLTRLVPFAAVASAGALNVFLMRGEEIRQGIDIFPTLSEEEKKRKETEGEEVKSLGKSRKAATLAVGETALSRVLNSTPIMVLPPLILVRLQETEWLKRRPRMVLPVNLGMKLSCTCFRRYFPLIAVKDSSLRPQYLPFHWLSQRSHRDRLFRRPLWRRSSGIKVGKMGKSSLIVEYR